MDIKWRVGRKPDDMTYAGHQAVMLRHNYANPPCENWQEGLCSDRDEPCQPPDEQGFRALDFAHRQAKSLGGSYDPYNIRLECACRNRSYGAVPDSSFADASPFEDAFDYSRLRYSQGAYLEAAEAAAPLWCEMRDRTRGVVLLCVGVTGAGKLIGVLAMLHRIAAIAASRGPLIRPKHVLWLVPERALATALAAEASREPVELGMRASALRVFDAGEGGFDLARPPEAAGIVFGCVQFLWEVANGRRSDADVAAILAHYDTIVWDECDFAENQLQRIVTLGPHLLKFGVTATPITGSGRFLHRFVVGPVIGYRLVSDEDGALKVLEAPDGGELSRSLEVMAAHSHREATGDAEVTQGGESNDLDSITAVMVQLRRAIGYADELEARMRRMRPGDYFSPHLMVRCQSVKQAEEVFLHINEMLRGMALEGLGWRAALMYSDMRMYPSRQARVAVPENERRLGVVDADSRPLHPWFAAKLNDGMATAASARILVIVDMGIRGLNNWPCSFVVDLTGGQSLVDDVQFVGRGLRWPASRADWLIDPDLAVFACMRAYLTVNSRHKAVHWYTAALDFIVNLEAKMADSGLATWDDLIRLAPVAAEWRPLEPDDPFSSWDRMNLDHALGVWAERTERAPEDASDEELSGLVDSVLPPMEGRRRDSGVEYLTRGARNADERRQRWTRPDGLAPLTVVRREHPKEAEDYSDAEMVRSIMEAEACGQWEAQRDWDDTPTRVQALLRRQRAEEDRRLFVAPVRLRNLHRTRDGEGIVTTKAVELYREAVRRGIVAESNEVHSSFHAATTDGVRRAFGLTVVDNNSKVNEPEYHFKLLSIAGGRRIHDEAFWILVERGVIPLGRAYGR